MLFFSKSNLMLDNFISFKCSNLIKDLTNVENLMSLLLISMVSKLLSLAIESEVMPLFENFSFSSFFNFFKNCSSSFNEILQSQINVLRLENFSPNFSSRSIGLGCSACNRLRFVQHLLFKLFKL